MHCASMYGELNFVLDRVQIENKIHKMVCIALKALATSTVNWESSDRAIVSTSRCPRLELCAQFLLLASRGNRGLFTCF